MSSVFSPNMATMRLAMAGPIPEMAPEARNFSMPDISVGATARQETALNCWPNLGCCVHSPSTSSSCPTSGAALFKMTVIFVERFSGVIFKTVNRLSVLAKTMVSTVPRIFSIKKPLIFILPLTGQSVFPIQHICPRALVLSAHKPRLFRDFFAGPAEATGRSSDTPDL